MDIEKLTDKQLAVVFHKIVEKIKLDPMTNFVRAGGFMDIMPSPAQEVILKIVFKQPLDSVEKKEVFVETQTQDNKLELSLIHI